MKIKLLADHADGQFTYPKGAIIHVYDRAGETMIKAGKAIRVSDDARARLVPYEDNFCVPPPRMAGAARTIKKK